MRRRREPLAFMLPRIVLQCGELIDSPGGRATLNGSSTFFRKLDLQIASKFNCCATYRPTSLPKTEKSETSAHARSVMTVRSLDVVPVALTFTHRRSVNTQEFMGVDASSGAEC
ncbi:uncharacterized protein LOC135161382 isoform X4 [Diachasmimorpha longicaudata]|uniref:uncharacterized protein LOC135161382 isoform X4 n=1 Tax=Diachasmimorpha longicaudata TaxID=58733 RepID=UPI0030B8F02F